MSALCIEASRAAAKVLRSNLELNGVTGRVRVMEVAAGADSRPLQMLTTGAGGADYFVIPSEPRPDAVYVRQATVTQICSESGFAPTHLKIDVEGYEEEVLRGAKECISLAHPILFLELHGELIRRRGKDPHEVLAVLAEMGYQRLEQQGREVSVKELTTRGFEARLVCKARG